MRTFVISATPLGKTLREPSRPTWTCLTCARNSSTRWYVVPITFAQRVCADFAQLGAISHSIVLPFISDTYPVQVHVVYHSYLALEMVVSVTGTAIPQRQIASPMMVRTRQRSYHSFLLRVHCECISPLDFTACAKLYAASHLLVVRSMYQRVCS